MVAPKTLLAATGTLALATASSFTTITTTSTEPATAAATITAPVAPPMPHGSGPTEAMIARRKAWCTQNNAEKRRAPGWYESPDEYAGAIGYCVRFYLDEYKRDPSKAGWLEQSMDRTLGRKKFLVADFERKASPAPTAKPVANDAAASKKEDPVSEDPVSEDPASEDEVRVNTAKMADILKESLGLTDEQLMELGFKLGKNGFALVHAPEEDSEASSSLLWSPKFGRPARPLTLHPLRKLHGKAPAANQPKGKGKEPAVEKPKVEQPKVEQPKPKVEYQKPKVEDEQPAAKEPKGKEIAVEQPAAKEPKSKEPAVEQPAAKEPKGKEPAGEQPKADQPKADQPKADRPKVDEPAAKDAKSKKSKDEEMPHHDHPHGGHHAHPHHDEHDKEKEEEEKKKKKEKEKEKEKEQHPYHPDHPPYEEEPLEDHPTPNPTKIFPH
ncbi:hypothetical protein COL516b_003027 [Colletotrichum fioriniae]|nr:uncharacterized protein COL516b_003027 [Colletotrichum fioriniae]KAJ0309129.1 hypothetical protein COL516b_003027 [Colletotrichum fioriniae]